MTTTGIDIEAIYAKRRARAVREDAERAARVVRGEISDSFRPMLATDLGDQHEIRALAARVSPKEFEPERR